MVDRIEAALDYRLSIGRLILIVATIGIPYAVIGVIWACAHTEQLKALDDVDRLVSFVLTIASWPVLLVTDVCVM